MKAIRTILAAAICALALSSCEKEVYSPIIVEGDGYRTMENVVINVAQNKWGYSNQNDNNYFVANITMPEITKEVLNSGLIKMYRVFENGSSQVQVEMPYTRHNELDLGNGEWYFYTETIDYEFGEGFINIFYTANDFDYELDTTFIPEAMKFRCVIVY